jgi:predicted NAD/FAD-dependent oxidoreductase
VAYATINGNQITGLIRGLGGTSAIAHSSLETVVECNIAWMGKRQTSQTYAPGQSTTILPITSGWDQLLVQYMAGRAKIVEHDFQSMQAFNAEMEKAIKGWAQTTNAVVRRRQVGGPRGPIVYYGDQAGGILIN